PAATARGDAAIDSSPRTREREQGRINAIVHDDIMSVLVTASRENPPETLGMQARVALARIEELASGSPEERTYTPEEIVAVLRSTVSDTAPNVDFTYELEGDRVVSAEVVAAFTEALAEAMRNSVIHAHRSDGPVIRSVRVAIKNAGISVVTRDNGNG